MPVIILMMIENEQKHGIHTIHVDIHTCIHIIGDKNIVMPKSVLLFWKVNGSDCLIASLCITGVNSACLQLGMTKPLHCQIIFEYIMLEGSWMVYLKTEGIL